MYLVLHATTVLVVTFRRCTPEKCIFYSSPKGDVNVGEATPSSDRRRRLDYRSGPLRCFGTPRNAIRVHQAESTPPPPLPITRLRLRSSSTKVQKRAALVAVVIDVRMGGDKLRGSLNRRGVRDEDVVW